MSIVTDSSTLLQQLEEKEHFEKYAMHNQKEMAIASMEEAFALWKKEQLFRRRRYIQQHGVQAAVEKGYHVPFWQWWINKLLIENVGE